VNSVAAEGRMLPALEDREIIIDTGQAAEFATMRPHAFAALDGLAALIMIFDPDGQRPTSITMSMDLRRYSSVKLVLVET